MSEGCTEEDWNMDEREQRNRKIRNNKIRIVIFL